jgi:hypothetical protein
MALFCLAAFSVSRFLLKKGQIYPESPNHPRAPGVRSGSPDERKRRRAHPVGEKTREPYNFLAANPPLTRSSLAAGTTPR